MGERLARLARIGPGEGRLAGALFAVMFAASAGAGAGMTGADALLFARYGTGSLPQLYLALGIASFVCALCVSIVFGAVRRERVYPAALGVLVVLLVALRVAVADGSDLGYPAMWLGANVVVMLQGILTWGVASWLCDARQAKRLFPIANAAKIAGAVAGGAAVVPLVLVFRLEDLLLLWALTLLATLAIVARLSRTAPAAPLTVRRMSVREELLAGLGVVRASSLLSSLALALVLFSVLFFALALPFTRAARAAIPQEDDLASFLGLFNATTTGAAFLASLLVANRFYARFGVVSAILTLTLIYLGGFVALVVWDGFAAVAAARWLQLAWLAGMADAAYQALLNPIPAERRDQLRAFMEGVPGQAGIALAGLVLLIGDRALDPRAVAAVGAVVAAVTAAVVWRTRGAHRDALIAALRAGRPEPFVGAELGYAGLLGDAAAVAVAREGLRSELAATRRAAAQILGEIGPRGVQDALLVAARDGDPLVRAFALRGGARLDATAFVDAARASVDDADPEARLAALLVLQRAGDAEAPGRLRAEAAGADPASRIAAVRAVAQSTIGDAAALLAALTADVDLTVRRAALHALAERDAARALAIAEERLGDPSAEEESLHTLEGLPGARVSRALWRYTDRERQAALRYTELMAAVPPNGEAARLLSSALGRRANDAARRAVRGAAVLSGRQAPAAVLDGLSAADRRVRADALEGLEACVRADLARSLLPIWEGARVARSLDELRGENDEWLRACGAAIADGGGDVANLITVPLMERVLFLHRVPLFASLDPADLQQVARVATERGFVAGETAFQQGERGDALYVVLEGALRIEQDGRDVARRGPGDVVGETSILSDAPRIATGRADEPTRTLRIGRADFEAILRDRPETALGVIRVLTARLAEATAAM